MSECEIMASLLSPPRPSPPSLVSSVCKMSLLVMLAIASFLMLGVSPGVQSAGAAGVNQEFVDPENAIQSSLFDTFDETSEEEEKEVQIEIEPWVALMKGTTSLIEDLLEPYLLALPKPPMSWKHLMIAIKQVVDRSALAIGPIRTAVVGLAAITFPIIMQVARAFVTTIAALVDNTVFALTGFGLGRSIPDNIREELADISLRTLHLIIRMLGKGSVLAF